MLDDEVPGLSPAAGVAHARLLALRGAIGQGVANAGVAPGMLIDNTPLRGGVAATYRLMIGGDVALKAVWSTIKGADGIDLEVSANTRTVGLVQTLEIILGSRWPRSCRAESVDTPIEENPGVLLASATRGAITLMTGPAFPGQTYVEMVQPFGLLDQEIADEGTSYRLFGHDLERGVLLRARIRGVWTASEGARETAITLWGQFTETAIHLGL